MLARQQLEGHDPERIEIGAGIDSALAARLQVEQLFGSHVRYGSADDLAAGFERREREVEVEQHGLAGIGEEYVGGLEIEVEDAAFVAWASPLASCVRILSTASQLPTSERAVASVGVGGATCVPDLGGSRKPERERLPATKEPFRVAWALRVEWPGAATWLLR